MDVYRREGSPFWYARFKDDRGKTARRSTGETDRARAWEVAESWSHQAREQRVHGKEPDHTFAELMAGFLEESGHEVTPSTQQRNIWAVRNLRGFFGDDAIINAMTGQDITRYTAKRRHDGVTDATIAREYNVLSSAINRARRLWEWGIGNPVEGRKPPVPPRDFRWLKPEEAERLIQSAKESARAPYLADFIILALMTGMRKGELLGLSWDRVQLDGADGGGIVLEGRHTKTKKSRRIPLNGDARAALVSRANFRASHCPGSPWVFCNARGERVQNPKRGFKAACQRAGVLPLRIHDLRHTCASWLVMAGVPLIEVRDLLGHSSVQTTEIYAHLMPKKLGGTVAALSKVRAQIEHTDATGVLRIQA